VHGHTVGWRLLARRHDTGAVQFAWSGGCGDRRTAMIFGRQQGSIVARGIDLGGLLLGWRQVALVGEGFLLRSRPLG
jgi:uncharacterized protein (DUF779 family)